jgi:hypothetical protein
MLLDRHALFEESVGRSLVLASIRHSHAVSTVSMVDERLRASFMLRRSRRYCYQTVRGFMLAGSDTRNFDQLEGDFLVQDGSDATSAGR